MGWRLNHDIVTSHFSRTPCHYWNSTLAGSKSIYYVASTLFSAVKGSRLHGSSWKKVSVSWAMMTTWFAFIHFIYRYSVEICSQQWKNTGITFFICHNLSRMLFSGVHQWLQHVGVFITSTTENGIWRCVHGHYIKYNHVTQ